MEFVRNAWYVAAWSSEIDDDLRRFTILDEHIVMYRKTDGTIAALEDRCPHRLLPLSLGTRKGDDIQCGYHGMTFDCDGKCVRIPGQSNLPSSAYVVSYPVHERHGIVWIWTGDREKADPDDIFDMPEFTDPDWLAHHGDALHLKANYMNVAENLVDPAHVSFVHPTTLGNAASENVPVHVSTEGETIVAWRWIRDAEPIGFFRKFGGFTDNVDRWHYYYLHTPSIAVIDFGSAPTTDNLAEDERNKGNRIFALHFLTPVTRDHTIDRWMHIRNTAIDDEAASESMDAMFRIAFQEDKDVLEAIQQEEDRPAKRRPIRIAIDKGPMVYRKRISELIEKERTQDLASSPTPAYVYHD
ncbi:aromatic ring-hydroxylating dioxygenase subunit alpha [Labrenzia sp. 011]|uniref:aromatic ring-hydroxylating dioxygenase subunit alpha n=1 Tax=Labrenzia sp. 011 TaxID=2171494 RepID=UPI000D5242F3|nr:aromatic ring-hydroxylating dioxygenase subunit alpha [Labrenzia sp. 011]PVB60125.1 vanillate O-demethylase oxygenase [Labrenzia sp. 011]